ncbi:junctional adhesion molecule 2A isoform X2 [Denticeps clupeoides]|uniref:junctional adhesion molecule 2A isoform X2 n=1 Tax=Denticeps clupeoides TaxID=299321 RepID=UPI0010A41105|nr:junctional adhesion molecule B isoform X2 [Denticeps clupeoides]
METPGMERSSPPPTLLLRGAFLLLMLLSPCAPVVVTTDRPVVEAHENGEAYLSCLYRTQEDRNPRIEWKKKGKDTSFVYYDGKFRGPFEGRAKIDGASVTLARVTQEDAGEYRCEVSAPLDSITLGETNVTLVVLVPPHTPSCEIPSSAVTGSAVELHCRDHHSVPAATYTWYKDKMPLQRQLNASYTADKNTGVLLFKSVSRADTGLYHCEARNRVGPPKSCKGNHMQIDDLNVPGIIAGVVVICLIISVCALAAWYAQRHGFFSRHRGRNTHYSHAPEDKQDFKHTRSFML